MRVPPTPDQGQAAQTQALDDGGCDTPISSRSAPSPQADLAHEPTDDELMTAWERDFFESIESQDYLTERQEEKRDEILALIEQRRQSWRDPTSSQDHRAAWQPIGSVLERAFQALDFIPTAESDDPAWKHWHARPGDLIEVCGAHEAIGRWFVTHASPAFFKIEDKRCFAQEGWPIVSGKRSKMRARKVREQ